MTTVPTPGALSYGVPAQSSETFDRSNPALFIDANPQPSRQDYQIAFSQTILERQVLGFVDGKLVPATYAVAAGAKAARVLSFSGVGTANDTITIGGVVYTLVAAADAPYEVTIGGSAGATATNLTAVINGTDANATPAHPAVVASVNSADVTVTVRVAGDEGNTIALAESGSNTSWASSATTLTGGSDGGQVGIRAAAVAILPATTDGDDTTAIPVYRSGHFNVDALVWDASFDTLAKKLAAFEGAPSPTNILVGKVRPGA